MARISLRFSLFIVTFFFFVSIIQCQSSTVKMFVGQQGCNVYLVTNGDKNLLVETGGQNDAQSILKFLDDNNVDNLDLIFITHGHVDHFGGTGQITAKFSSSPVAVASNDIKNELLKNANDLGIIDFDFEKNVEIIVSNNVLGALNLKIVDDFLPGESDFASVLINSKENFAFAGDIVGVNSHLYLGPTLDTSKLLNWLEINLPSFNTGERLKLNEKTIIYPGHGENHGDNSYIAKNQDYLNYFIDTLFTCVNGRFPYLEEVSTKLLNEFESYSGAFVVPYMTYNNLWVEAQDAFGICSFSDPNYFGYDYNVNSYQGNGGNGGMISFSNLSYFNAIIFIVVFFL